jgi:serine/threonine-protein kinase
MEVLLRRLERALGHRRRIAGGLLALGGLAAIAAWPEETPDCDPSLRVRESWSPERRAEIEAALAAASTRSSTSRVTGVMAEVDGWVERWRESYVRVCEATLVERIQSEALLDARMMCLDRDRAELDALLAVFEAADAEVAQRAVPAVGRLRRPEDCRHQGAELLAMAPPEPAPRIEVEAVRQVLHRVRALHEAGKYERAHVLAVAALRRATATGFAPVRVEAQLRLGMALGKIGQYTQAETELATAHWDAEAIRHEDVATTAAIELVFLLGDRQQRAADARLWGSHADAARRRAGSQSRHEADLLNAVGAAHTTAGAYDEALEAFDRSLEIKRRLYGEHHYEVAMALGNIGNVLDNRGQADRARDYLERSVSMCETLLGSDHPTVGLMVGNLAGVVHHQAQFSEARALYERAIEIKQAALGPDHPSVAFAIDGLGVTLQRLGDYDGAARAHRRALEIAIERLGPEHPFVAAAWTNLGNTHVTTGDHPAARHAFEQALAINVARMGEHHAAVSSPLMGLGVVALAEGDLDGATRYHEQALRAVTQHLGSEDWRVGLAESNLGLVAHRKGAKDRAREHYERARNVLEASLPPEHPDRRVLAERIAALEETP